MRTILNNIAWILFAVFSIPTILVLGTWNTLPGQLGYGIKLGMESVLLLLVSPSYQTSADLSIKYTERRFSENQKLLSDKADVQGLAYLDKQVVATKDVIVKGNDAKAQAELAQKYIDTLNDVSTQLAAQQQVIAQAPPAEFAAPTGQAAPVSGGTAPVAITNQNQPSQSNQPYQPPTTIAPATPTQVRLAATPTPYIYTQPTSAPTPTPRPTSPAIQQPIAAQPVQQQPARQQPTVQAPAGASVKQAVAIQQINQSQETIKETIKELKEVAKKAEQEEKKQDKQQEQQPSDRGNKGGGKD